MTVAKIALNIETKFHSEMTDKDDRLIVKLFSLPDRGQTWNNLAKEYDSMRIKYCQRHRPPQVILEKYRTGDPFPATVRSLFWEILKLSARR